MYVVSNIFQVILIINVTLILIITYYVLIAGIALSVFYTVLILGTRTFSMIGIRIFSMIGIRTFSMIGIRTRVRTDPRMFLNVLEFEYFI